MNLCREERTKYGTLRKRRTCKRSNSQEENSEVHLLPAFALPPKGVEGEKKAERKRREINAHYPKRMEEMIED